MLNMSVFSYICCGTLMRANDKYKKFSYLEFIFILNTDKTESSASELRRANTASWEFNEWRRVRTGNEKKAEN